jgi:uncharacterized membrane protein
MFSSLTGLIFFESHRIKNQIIAIYNYSHSLTLSTFHIVQQVYTLTIIPFIRCHTPMTTTLIRVFTNILMIFHALNCPQ